jgi:hypothetical protein
MYVVLGLLIAGEYVFVIDICFPMFQTQAPFGSTLQGFFYLLGWHILMFMTVTSYIRCVFTDPGSVPVGIEFQTKELSRDKNVRKCDICNSIKPDRTHHCSICRKCVLKMDHHCPWVNNCVGWRNYKFFILFLFYTTLLSFYYVACVIPVLYTFHFTILSNEQIHIVIVLVAGVSFGLGLLCFTGQHVQLAMQNITTLESFSKTNQYNPYDMGQFKNWSSVFGKNPLFWFVPVYTHIGNGYEFETKEIDVEAGNTLIHNF